MRVLAIRGKNLASLDGEFEVDLRGDRLGRVGLFAITGPTGSGKSTLLDALSVALYGKTPRLSGHGGVQVGAAGTEEGDRTRANDPRNLLRRGRGSGFAQVDFVGGDGHPYRATWTVRRARERADGRLQNVDLVLTRLGSETPIGRTKTEVLEELQRLVGLDFDQFRRSVLLAQGDFAAFLHADPDERAALLERMTGTEIYARLSQAAFRRAKEERQAIGKLHTQLEAVQVLDDEARAELETELADARAALTEATAARESVKTQHDWLVETARAEGRVAEAKSEIARSETAIAARSDDRAELVRLDALRPLRPKFERWKEAGDRRDKADELAEAARVQAAATARARDHAEGVLARAVASLDRHLHGLGTELTELDAELAADERVARVEPVWDDVRAGLETLTEQETAVAERAKEASRVEARVREAAATAVAAAGARDKAHERLRGAEQASKTAEDALADFDRDALDAERRDAEQRLRAVERRSELFERWRSTASQVTELQADQGRADAEATIKRGRVAELESRLPELDVEHKQAVRSLRAAEATQSLDDRRSDLVDGEPCPLCGATEHPYADHGPVHAALGALRGEIERVEGERTAAREERAQLLSWIETHDRRTEERTGEIELITTTRDEARDAWRATFDGEAPETPTAPTDDELRAAEELVETTGARHTQLRNVEATARTAREAVEQARAAHEAARTKADAASSQKTKLDLELGQARSRLEQARSTRDTARAAVERRLGAIDWTETTPSDLLDGWTERVDGHRAARDRREGLRERRDALAPEQRRLAALVSTDDVEPEWPAATALDESAPDEVVAQLAGLETSWREASTEAGRHESAAATHAEGAAAAAEEVERHEQEFARAVAAASEDRTEVERLLARPEADVEQLRKELQALDDALRTAQTRIEERQSALAERVEHRPAPPELDPAPDWDDADAVQARLADAEGRRKALDEDHAKLVGRLHTDDAHREQSEGLRRAVAERQEQARVWLQLDDLIGSSDGKRFRMFAQGLTLDVLLQEANHQLQDLARRYRLERVPGEDLALQVVDADLGDEVRAISSLSGGESFLVSLALALGLASMTSQTTPVESLFIDEGFGTLDPESLDLAVSALDALQADGRQVGVISHVQGLAEQIGVQVRITPRGGGRSTVAVVG